MKARVALGVAAATIAAFMCLPRESRERLRTPARRWLGRRLEHVLTNLPEDAPPRLIMSILPRLREQNDQIIALLREQNSLLRESRREVHSDQFHSNDI